MPVRYTHISTAAWMPSSPTASIVAGYRTLSFPEHWQQRILELCSAGRAEPLRNVPTARLEHAMQALLPDLLILPRPRQGRTDPETPWLLVPDHVEPPPDLVFWKMINDWLGELCPEGEREKLKETRAALATAPPRWTHLDVELLRCGIGDGGTAIPEDHQYTLLTDWVARRIGAHGPYPFEGGHLEFRAVPRGPRDQGAELVSQPLRFDGGKRPSWFSVVLNVTLQTVPFEPLPRLHLHCSIRRWATRAGANGQVRIPARRRVTVLLRPSVPWLAGAPYSERFAVAHLTRRWDDDARGYVTDWAYGGPTRILSGGSLGQPFPSAQQIVTEPERWLTDDMHAAIVHSTAMGAHEIGAGLMSHQRSQIVAWAAQALPGELRPIPTLAETTLAKTSPANALKRPTTADAKAAEAVRAATERRTNTAFALNRLAATEGTPVLEARLLWQTPLMRDTAVAQLVSHLGLPGDGGAPEVFGDVETLTWLTPELAVRLRCLKLVGGLAEGLPCPDGQKRNNTTVAAAVRERRVAVEQFLKADAPGILPTVALVELDRRQDFASGDHDPKFALRLGCADARVLTQFVLVPKRERGYDSVKNAPHRAEKAWSDALRQLGVRVHPEHTLEEGVPTGLRYVAIWLVRKNRTTGTRWAGHLPVAVRVTPAGSRNGLAWVEGWDPDAEEGAGAWVSYPDMLLGLARRAEVTPAEGGTRGPLSKDMDEQRRTTEEWLQRLLRTLRRSPTLLLVHAQNARSHWTWIQDGQIQADRIRTGHAPARPIDLDLRLARIRSPQGRETPQWWGIHPDAGVNGLPSQLWTLPGVSRVFWSTTPKASQFTASAVEADKLAPRVLQRGKNKGGFTIDTDKPAWNPGLVEISILGCHEHDGDDPEALAAVLHQMRRPPDYPDALALPLPLHLARLAQEYVLPVPSDEENEEG
ncbi:pPIWI_RE module domain-containing protein [Streptosporangium saharense]|uniref:pPIWI_RE module domain-containing protein n=2 Tax=Streptosporangium saharense TaxID=1706840 RepID=UPI0036918685